MAINKTGKTLASFNVKNGQYAVDSTIASLTWLTRFSKEKNLSIKTIYGDGEIQANIVNDKGFTGTIGLTAQDLEYNKSLGFMMDIDGGVAEIRQVSQVNHSLYFETEMMIDGVSKLKKVWVFGVETSAPSESLDQTTEDINENIVEYAITVKGINLKNAVGDADYVDPATGEYVKVFTYSKMPTDEGYATFGDSVPVPKMPTPPAPPEGGEGGEE